MQTTQAEPPLDEREENHPSAFGDVAASIGSRNLMIIILTMPLVFIAVVWTVIAVFGSDEESETAVQSTALKAPQIEALAEPVPAQGVVNTNALSASPATISPAAINLAAGADVAAMALDGERLALRIDGPEGVSVVIYDLAAGKVVQTIPIKQGADE